MKYKLGEQILLAGQVPKGLYIIKEGYCKVGIDVIRPVQVDTERYSKRRSSSQNEVPFAYGSDFKDPLRRERIEHKEKNRYKIAKSSSSQFGEIRGDQVNDPADIKKMQTHENSVKQMLGD